MSDLQIVYGSLFEEDYLVRTLGPIAHDPYIALTELVANAWDAGASRVDIFIPEEIGQNLQVKDDGTGLTQDQFQRRWMKLGYNRIKHQGNHVEFPTGRTGQRLAYGRNGIGRHGLLCFNDEYTVETCASAEQWTFIISTHNEHEPFIIKDQTSSPSDYLGTTLKVVVARNLPSLEKARDVISARFLHDPAFKVFINGSALPLDDLVGHVDSREKTIAGVDYRFHFIDTTKANRSTIYQGVAFWQAGRLVGEPSWSLGGNPLLDGRTRYAKQFTAVIETSGLADWIKEDWTGFKPGEVITNLYKEVADYVNEMFAMIAIQNLEDTKRQIKQDYKSQIDELSGLGKYEVDQAIESITLNHPTTRPEVVSVAVEAVINIEKSRSGKSLLQKLAKLTDEDIEGLDRLLSEWTIKDALYVLDEIDKRISVIEAIRKLSGDREVDELRVLHPLITEARWLFGPEFDSPEYTSNRQLGTVMKQVFGKEVEPTAFLNPRKRPDLVITKSSTLSCTGTESINPESQLFEMKQILLIELKRGGFKIGRDERNQAQGYVEDILGCGSLIGTPFVFAYVVGETIDSKTLNSDIKGPGDTVRGKLFLTNYAQLVDTAERRLFNLRTRLNERYEELPDAATYKKASIQPELAGFDTSKEEA